MDKLCSQSQPKIQTIRYKYVQAIEITRQNTMLKER